MLLYFLAAALTFLSGCAVNITGGESDGNNTSNPRDNLSVNKGVEHQSLSKDYILISELNTDSWMSIDLPEVGLKNLILGNSEKGSVIKSDSKTPVYIFCDYARYDNGVYHDCYLAVVTESKILLKDLSDYDCGSYEDSLYLCDTDGDGIDEIIVQQTVAMSGGTGGYLSRIFTLVGDKIQEVFSSTAIDGNLFDTGFTSEFLNGYRLKITNKITGYYTNIDISNRYIGEFFDENGKGKSNNVISCDSFMEFVPKDIDGDGVCEIVCKQYASLESHADYIGYTESVLKINSKAQKFEVVKAEFIMS